MKKAHLTFFLALFVLALTGASALFDGDNERHTVRANLTGFQEPPSVSSTGRGEFRASLNDASIEFELSYSDLEGSVQQAHIHIGQRGVNGGIMIFLCTNLGNGPAGTPTCPGPNSGTVTGTRTASEVVPVAAQGIAAGEFAEVLRAIRSGNTYANVHSTKHPGGEIRGQIRTDNERNPH